MYCVLKSAYFWYKLLQFSMLHVAIKVLIKLSRETCNCHFTNFKSFYLEIGTCSDVESNQMTNNTSANRQAAIIWAGHLGGQKHIFELGRDIDKNNANMQAFS